MNWALPEGVQALCTTRRGGVSNAPFDGLNLGDHVGDDPRAVAQNRALLQAQLSCARPVFLTQVHGVDVAEVHASTPDGTRADACITQDVQVACTIMVADCLPLLFTDDAGQVVAAAHAGWRGLAAGVIEQTVHAMCEQAGVAPAQVRAWLGPCIGPVAKPFRRAVELCTRATLSRSPADLPMQISRRFPPFFMLLLLAACTALYLVVALAMGLLVSTLVARQQHAGGYVKEHLAHPLDAPLLWLARLSVSPRARFGLMVLIPFQETP